ncbi:Tll0287-like domain-containing protein [Roseibium sp.]|uniref:Tll0287-like domain-containing protein n=1 Tax=Roseibium sp. TaxID=1936156 RepID=UPI003BAFB312
MPRNFNKLAAAGLGALMLAVAPQTVANADGIEPRDVTDMLHAVMDSDRTIYTKMIVGRLVAKHKLIKASEFFEDDVAAPLPAQMFRMGAEAVADRTDLFEYSLQSLWPINKPNAENQTELEKEGLQFVADNIGENFYGEEEIDGTTYFTAVYPDIAVAEVCASCHNDHKDSPRTDFKLGDVMGGVVIRIPLDG